VEAPKQLNRRVVVSASEEEDSEATSEGVAAGAGRDGAVARVRGLFSRR
jgi:hypothetical protein